MDVPCRPSALFKDLVCCRHLPDKKLPYAGKIMRARGQIEVAITRFEGRGQKTQKWLLVVPLSGNRIRKSVRLLFVSVVNGHHLIPHLLERSAVPS